MHPTVRRDAAIQLRVQQTSQTAAEMEIALHENLEQNSFKQKGVTNGILETNRLPSIQHHLGTCLMKASWFAIAPKGKTSLIIVDSSNHKGWDKLSGI